MQEDALTISCFGVQVEVRASASLSRHLPVPLIPGARRVESGRGGLVFSLRHSESPQGSTVYTVSGNRRIPVSKSDLGEAVTVLQSQMQEAVARRASERVFVHAGVVGWRGKAILIPGRSFSGKSTLAMALVQAGATYYSDEYAVLDSEGRVCPYARVPQLRNELGKDTARRLMNVLNDEAEDLKPLPAGLIVLSKFQRDAVWQPRPLTSGQALLGLVRNTVAIRKQPEISMMSLTKVANRAKAYRTLRCEAAEAASAILELCEVG